MTTKSKTKRVKKQSGLSKSCAPPVLRLHSAAERMAAQVAFAAAAAALRCAFCGDDIPKRGAARKAFEKAYADYRATW